MTTPLAGSPVQFTATATVGGAFNPTANRPAGYNTVLTDYAFNAVIPTTGTEVPVGDGSGWNVVGNDGDMFRGSDATAPISPSNVLEWTYVAGSGTPTSSAGFGKLYRVAPTAMSAMYVQFAVWHDANFEFNIVSNKLFYDFVYNGIASGVHIFATTLSGQFLIWVDEANNAVPTYGPNTAYGAFLSDCSIDSVNREITGVAPSYFRGHWINIELQLIYGSSGTLRAWIGRSDGSEGSAGQLIMQHTGVVVAGPGGSHELQLDSTWGGGNGPTKRNSTRRIDHVLIAHP